MLTIPQRLARWLDRPLFPWKRLVVGFSLAEFALENWLLYRQYRVLQKTTVPKALGKEIEQSTFDKSQVRNPSIHATVSKLTSMTGIWPRKGKVQLHLRSLQPGQIARHSLLQPLPARLGHRRHRCRSLCARPLLGRDHTIAALHVHARMDRPGRRTRFLLLP
jgi:hypothetical protein